MDKPFCPLKWPAVWDVVVVGGGATGLGCAVDAATRGLKVLLLEAQQFGQGSSGRSSKLIHGGVRYLAQGRLRLVRQALRERARLCANAPGLVWPLPFVVPVFSWGAGLWYWLGLKLYQALAGKRSLGPTQWLGVEQVLQHVPSLAAGTGLCGGVLYWDAQFDEEGLIAALACTAKAHRAVLLENAVVQSLQPMQGEMQVGFVYGHQPCEVRARVVINAAGPWVDQVRRLLPTAQQGSFKPLLQFSQGAHVVLPSRFFAENTALLVPRTADGRVLFVMPWRGQVLVGTTETPVAPPAIQAPGQHQANPQPTMAEIEFLLRTAAPFLNASPTQADVLQSFAGFRPLLQGGGQAQGAGATAGLSREHCVLEELPGLITVAGGKWTTYRQMAQDAVDLATARLQVRVQCKTADLDLIV